MAKQYKTIDLCAGIGGIRTGFTMTGRFENILSAEIDADARRTYEHLYGEVPRCDLTSATFKNEAALLDFDVMLAGFPCQTFSAVGLKAGFEDPNKGIIFDHLMDLLARCQHAGHRPKAIFLENVEYLLAHDKGKTINIILDRIAQMHYRVVGDVHKVKLEDGTEEWVGMRKSFLRNSRNFGVPQNRPRVYIMAFDERYFGDALGAIAGKTLPVSGVGPGWMDVNSILEKDVSKVDDKFYLASGYLATLERHRARHADSKKKTHNGFGYVVVNDPRKDGKKCISNTILATGGAGKECNLVRQVKPGLNTTTCIHGKKTPLNNKGVRMMMPYEWGRLQGFIDYGVFSHKTKGNIKFSLPDGLSNAQMYKQFGNSVTIPVIESMAKFMLECLDDMEKETWDAKVLGFVRKCKSVTRNQLMNYFHLDVSDCVKLIKRLLTEKKIFQNGARRGTFYTLFPGVYTQTV